MGDKSTQGLYNRFTEAFWVAGKIILVIAALAIAKEFLDLYRESVRLQQAQVQIDAQRHQIFMEQLKQMVLANEDPEAVKNIIEQEINSDEAPPSLVEAEDAPTP